VTLRVEPIEEALGPAPMPRQLPPESPQGSVLSRRNSEVAFASVARSTVRGRGYPRQPAAREPGGANGAGGREGGHAEEHQQRFRAPGDLAWVAGWLVWEGFCGDGDQLAPSLDLSSHFPVLTSPGEAVCDAPPLPGWPTVPCHCRRLDQPRCEVLARAWSGYREAAKIRDPLDSRTRQGERREGGCAIA
jgi:hypothetical protein